MAIDWVLTAIMAGIILVAGVVRGYSGFGFSMVAVISLSLAFPPPDVVPVIFLLEVIASAWLLPRVLKQVDWKSLTWLAAGVLFGTPVGVYLLASVPPRPMRAAIALVVVILAVSLWSGLRLRTMPGRGKTMLTGLVSGILNGATTIGAPPVILFYLSTPAGVAVSRASLIAFFLGTDLLALGVCAAQGLVSIKTGALAGACVAPMLIGIGLGNRFFDPGKAGAFRRRVLVLLVLLALIVLIRAIGDI